MNEQEEDFTEWAAGIFKCMASAKNKSITEYMEDLDKDIKTVMGEGYNNEP